MCETCGGHGPQDGAQAAVRDGVRAVLAGKGGVGKSTLTALLARTLARSGERVIAIDADEQRNLGALLGVDAATLRAHPPLAEDVAYVEEKTGLRPGEGAGGMLRLNPDTSDVVARRALSGPDGVSLLVMGGVRRAGGGCLCPEHALLSSTIASMRLRRGDVVLMDTHAGVEHFGRSLAQGFDVALVVVEPTHTAVDVGLETARLARDLGIPAVRLVVNRARCEGDLDRVLERIGALGGFSFDGTDAIPFDDTLSCSLETDTPSVAAPRDDLPLAFAIDRLAGALLGRTPALSHGAVA